MLRALAAIVLAATLPAQVVQVPNTGCPSAGYPQTSPAARIGQPFDVVWPCRPPAVAFCLFGWPSGSNLPLTPPITCIAGPCNLYVATLVVLPSGPIGQWSLPIPPDRRLVHATFALQTGCLYPTTPCLLLSGAVSLAIQP